MSFISMALGLGCTFFGVLSLFSFGMSGLVASLENDRRFHLSWVKHWFREPKGPGEGMPEGWLPPGLKCCNQCSFSLCVLVLLPPCISFRPRLHMAGKWLLQGPQPECQGQLPPRSRWKVSWVSLSFRGSHGRPQVIHSDWGKAKLGEVCGPSPGTRDGVPCPGSTWT